MFAGTEIARPETATYRHWVNEMPLAVLERHPLLGLTLAAVSEAKPGQPYRAYRAYTNHAAFGDVLFSHTDCLPDQHDLTALWYLCEEWDTEWGGETVFLDAHDEIAASIRPRPGRLALFDGAIKHAGRPPARICYAPRYTLAIKFERQQA